MTLRLTLALAVLLLCPAAAPAGTATVDIEDGTVTVVDDAGGDTLTIDRAGQSVVVTPGPATDTEVPDGSACLRAPLSQVVTCPGGEQTVVRGNGGDDTLRGGPDDDVLLGGSGADVLDGAGGDDELTGGAGNDDLLGGDGIDRARFPGALPQRVTLDGTADDGGAGEADNARADIEDVTTGSGDDAIAGSDAANDVVSGGGADTIDPGGGGDRVRTGPGDDLVRTRDGHEDTVLCGDGGDRLISDAADGATGCERVDALSPPAPPDAQRPQIALTLAPSILARDMRKGVPMTIASDEPVTAEIELIGRSSRARVARAGDFVLATRTARDLQGAREVIVTIARRRLRMIRRRAVLTVRVTAGDASGNLTVLAQTFRVR